MKFIIEIIKRYPKYGPLNKLFIWCGLIGVVGSICTVLALFRTSPTRNFNWPEVFRELQRRQHQGKQQPLLTRTFWLLKEPGASITMGPCPSDKCLSFRLGKIEIHNNILTQRVYVHGGGLQIKSRAAGTSKYLFEMDNMIEVRGSSFVFPFNGSDPWISLAIRKGAYFKMFSKAADFQLKVLDTRTDSLRLQLQVTSPTGKRLIPPIPHKTPP